MSRMIGAIQKYAGPKTERIVQETIVLLHLPHTINTSTSIIFHNLLLNLKAPVYGDFTFTLQPIVLN